MTLAILSGENDSGGAVLPVRSVNPADMDPRVDESIGRAIVVLLNNTRPNSPFSVGFTKIRRIRLTNDRTLPSLLQDLESGPPAEGWQDPKFSGRPRPLQINVRRGPVNVIVKLSKDLDAQFAIDAPPFSRDANDMSGRLRGARYFANGGLAPLGNQPAPTDCRIALFEVHKLDNEEIRDGLRFNINLRSNPDADGNSTPVIIDPDVRHPEGNEGGGVGGGGFLFEDDET